MKMESMVAVVTGASVGIGRAIAAAIASEGGKVALVARSSDGLETTRKSIENAGGTAKVFVTDLRNEEDIIRLAEDVKKEFGDVDIVVNVAGVWHGEDSAYSGPRLHETPAEQINEVLDVGIRAPMLLTRLFLPEMINKKRGKILNISGTFFSGATGWLHYYVSKKAIERFTAGLAEELQDFEIQVNCISPSDTATEPYIKFFPEYAENALKPSDVADIALFLLSAEADHITGQIIVVRNRADTSHYVFAQ